MIIKEKQKGKAASRNTANENLNPHNRTHTHPHNRTLNDKFRVSE
ncbi:MAG: hypothetical protein ACI8PB_000008 [Desulforhopalus sp.]|jgi:hypothetical protein